MKTRTYTVFAVLLSAMMLLGAAGVSAQHPHEQKGGTKKPGEGMQTDMGAMMREMRESPHHKLMTAYVEGIAVFARTLRDQAEKPGKLDAEFARAAVAEIRHNAEMMEAGHEQHMQSMDAGMRAHMQMMMKKMDAERSALKEQVAALEKDVQAENPDAKQVAAHASAVLAHAEGMLKEMR